MPTSPSVDDPGRALADYAVRILVHCPACAGCTALRIETHKQRLSCTQCGYMRRWSSPLHELRQPDVLAAPRGLRLWLTTMTRGNTLWVYNAEHLEDLILWITATHRGRERTPIGPLAPAGGGSTRSMIGSLPAWVIIARNRQSVLRALGRLRAKLARSAAVPTGQSKSR